MDSDFLNIDEVQTPGISLDSRTLGLLELLTEKDQGLADMLKGAWVTLNTTDNPDMLPQVAHSMRELMEKAAIRLPNVPIEQGSNNLKNDVKALHEKWSVVMQGREDILSWSGEIDQPLLNTLNDIDTFFTGFLTKYQPRNEQSSALIQALDGSGSQMPTQILNARLKQWNGLRELFLSVAHHGKPYIAVEGLTDAIVELEDFLLNLITPEPIPDLDDLDILMAEGEAV